MWAYVHKNIARKHVTPFQWNVMRATWIYYDFAWVRASGVMVGAGSLASVDA